MENIKKAREVYNKKLEDINMGVNPFDILRFFREDLEKFWKKGLISDNPSTGVEELDTWLKNHVSIDEYHKLVKELYDDYDIQDLPPIAISNMGDKSEDEWSSFREHGASKDRSSIKYSPIQLGGSSMYSVLDEPKQYKGTTVEYMQKKYQGLINEEIVFDEKLAKRGHRAERTVQTDLKLKEFPGQPETMDVMQHEVMYQHPVFDFINANPDAYYKMGDEIGIIEIKSVSTFSDNLKTWKTGYPPAVNEAQIRTYMAVMNVNKGYFAVTWGYEEDENLLFGPIERNIDTEIAMIAEALYFIVEHVIKNRPIKDMKSTGSKVLDDRLSIYGDSDDNKSVIVVTPDDEELYDYVEELGKTYKLLVDNKKSLDELYKPKRKEIDEAMKRVEADMLDVIKDYPGLKIEGYTQDIYIDAETRYSQRVDTKAVRALKDDSLLKTTSSRKIKVKFQDK